MNLKTISFFAIAVGISANADTVKFPRPKKGTKICYSRKYTTEEMEKSKGQFVTEMALEIENLNSDETTNESTLSVKIKGDSKRYYGHSAIFENDIFEGKKVITLKNGIESEVVRPTAGDGITGPEYAYCDIRFEAYSADSNSDAIYVKPLTSYTNPNGNVYEWTQFMCAQPGTVSKSESEYRTLRIDLSSNINPAHNLFKLYKSKCY